MLCSGMLLKYYSKGKEFEIRLVKSISSLLCYILPSHLFLEQKYLLFYHLPLLIATSNISFKKQLQSVTLAFI